MKHLLRFVSAAERAGPGCASRGRPAHPFVSAAVAMLALAACTTDPAVDYLGGIGDPVRGAALHAPRSLGDTGRLAGRPADAAIAAAQLELLESELRTSPRYAPEINPAVTAQLSAARAEMRGWLGIAPGAPTEVVQQGLRRAAAAIREGSPVRAEAALAADAFAAGPRETLARLSAMPRLPQTAAAAGQAAAEVARLDRIGR